MARILVALSLLLLAAFTPLSASAETLVKCESTTYGGDYFEIRCPLASVGAVEWRFRAYFAGVHDDTAGSMRVSVDGREVTCDAGSTTKLLPEDSPGVDRLLECHLVLQGRANVTQELFVVLTWKHAQHAGHELVTVPKH